MLKVKYHQWNQSREQLREIALTADHPRTRERFMALYEICLGKSATEVGQQTIETMREVSEDALEIIPLLSLSEN